MAPWLAPLDLPAWANKFAHATRPGLALCVLCVSAVQCGCLAGGHGKPQPALGARAPLHPHEPMSLGWAPPPFDDRTVILFNGESWDGWVGRDGKPSPWRVQADGSVLAGGGDAITRREFLDFQLHVEFFCPQMPEKRGQARTNSGVYLHGRYEVQVLDSYGQAPAGNGCGAIYSIAAPMVNASRPPGSWQTYDIVFRAPRYDEVDALVELPRVTVLHNGIVIHNNLELPKPTPGGTGQGMRTMGPILLQDHGDPVRYRNIWVRSLD